MALRQVIFGLLCAVVAGCGHAEAPAASAIPEATQPCPAADSGYLRARLQGAIDAEIDWSAPTVAQCLGGPRPVGDGVRLVYRGSLADGPLLVVIGVAARPDLTSAHNVPANLTLVREGAGRFYATQGDDKCALDTLTQEPVAGVDGRYRLSARGYCTQPARALGPADTGAVLVSRFDVAALVQYSQD